jgi:hypothetical protein
MTASRRGTPAEMRRSICSLTTMALSTTMPTARISPVSERMLSE